MKVREVANVSTVTEMKKLLVKKLQDEETSFTTKDVKIISVETGFTVFIKGYENVYFDIKFEQDEYFGFIVWVIEKWVGFEDNGEIVTFLESKSILDLRGAMIELGYHIATRF